jgi:predicted RNase H-like nuclease (RuvC/YqgF family)
LSLITRTRRGVIYFIHHFPREATLISVTVFTHGVRDVERLVKYHFQTHLSYGDLFWFIQTR